MSERRQRLRYIIQGAWVRWEPYSLWRRLLGGRLPGDAEKPEEVDEMIDIAPGGMAFVAAKPPAVGDRIMLNIFAPDDLDPVISSGVVVTLRKDDQGRGGRAAVRFDKDLAPALVAKYRMIGVPEEEPVAEAIEGEAVQQAEEPASAIDMGRLGGPLSGQGEG